MCQVAANSANVLPESNYQVDTSACAHAAGGIPQDLVFFEGFDLPELLRATAWRTSVLKADSSTDRKSTRLNSSHEWISYAVFCLKTKSAGTMRTKDAPGGRLEGRVSAGGRSASADVNVAGMLYREGCKAAGEVVPVGGDGAVV